MRFCTAIVLLAWPTIASAALFSRKKKTIEPSPTPPEGIDLNKISERLRSVENKVDYVGDDIHEVVDRVDSVREGVQDVDWVMGNVNENLMRLEEEISRIDTSKRDMGTDTQRLLDAIEKDHTRTSSDLNQKLDVLTRNLESLTESVARVHHLLAVGSVMNSKAAGVNLPSPGGPPPPPPPPPFLGPPPPPVFTNKSKSPIPENAIQQDGFGAVLNQIRSTAPQKRLRKTGSKFITSSTDTSATTTEDERSTDSD